MNEANPTPQVNAVKPYENNPFFIATTGIDLLFKKAQSIGILLALLSGLSALSGLPSLFANNQGTQQPATSPAPSESLSDALSKVPMEVWLLIAAVVLVVVLIFLTIGIIIRGVVDYTAAQIAADKTATISDAFRAVLHNFWGYTWVLTIVGIKTFLWTLLFIIPGIIMSIRYSLAGVAYFDKALKGNASVTHSAALTKRAWLTTYASSTLLNLITFGAIGAILRPGTNAVLYRQLTEAGDAKPKAHILSWLTLLVPLALSILFFAGLAAVLMLLSTQLRAG